MSFLDEAKNLAQKAEELAKEHPDQVKAAIEKAEHAIDSATDGKYTDKIETAGDKAQAYLDKQ
jgi:F0F1-type ATP synthase membrane subunit b/b'